MGKEKRNKNCKHAVYRPNKNERKILALIASNQTNGLPTTTVDDIRKRLKLTKRKAYYGVNKLVDNKIVTNLGKSTFNLKLSKKGEDYVRTFLSSDLQDYSKSDWSILDRAHYLTITCPISHRPRNTIPEGFKASSKSDNLNWKHPQLIMNDKNNEITVQINDKSVSCRFHEIYGLDPHHIVHHALKRTYEIVKFLRDYGFKINRPKYCVSSQHHALSHPVMAEISRKFDIHWKSDRLVFDKSVKPNEFELVHPQFASDDFIRLVEVLEMFVRGEFTVEDFEAVKSLLKSQPILEKVATRYKNSYGIHRDMLFL